MDERASLPKRVIMITGASGFTGGHACRYFAGLGMEVAGIVRQSKTLPAIDGVRYYCCDLMDKRRVEELVRAIAPDYVLHLGGKNSVPESWTNPLLYMETNVLPTLYLLNALRPLPACRVLVAGTKAVFRLTPPYRPPHPYSLSKSLQKAAVMSWSELFGQAIMLAEPSNLIGPGPSTGFCALLGRHIAATERGEATGAFRISSRATRRDFLDVRDAVRAYGMMLEQGTPGGIYSVSSGKEHTLEEIATLFIHAAGTPVAVDWGSDEDSAKDEARQNAPGSGVPGWEPVIPLMTSISDILQYFRTGGGASI
ncbi:GDP-mannose 4,6-dehydratase [Paenibacillus sp. VCA1]|uniref:NAD-dependent epimerase/dehydratase family protein n=1 Tax=Paenibacillus sp. VCA1 TaxID=3039148 RepID=UPI002870F8A6|nr:GDP-mannose 4,6-dehydratase [Paenibacillus sp. VCA1]MDR9856679.1 GDP-mannose 4,6-dehydratase [Paenibacillus sp. VCA1]